MSPARRQGPTSQQFASHGALQQTEVPAESGTEPAAGTPKQVANAQRQLKVLQWVIPALTGSVLVVNARRGEQQRPSQVSKGLVGRLLPGR